MAKRALSLRRVVRDEGDREGMRDLRLGSARGARRDCWGVVLKGAWTCLR